MLKRKLFAAVTAAIVMLTAVIAPMPKLELTKPLQAEAGATPKKWERSGDINRDGFFNIADVVLFKRWLAGDEVQLGREFSNDWSALDFNCDAVLDIFDLVIMRKALVENINLIYHDNYYLNIREPIANCNIGGTATNGAIDTYHNIESRGVFMDGHVYNGGFHFGVCADSKNYPKIDFPLDGEYDTFKFVLGGDFADKNYNSSDIDYHKGSNETLTGLPNEEKAGLQVLVDDKVVDEFVFSCYDPVMCFSYNVTGAQKLTLKQVASSYRCSFPIYMYEITVWQGEGIDTGYVPCSEPAGEEAVKLIRDIRPYTIPNTSSAEYYPKYNPYYEGTEERTSFKMGNVDYTDVIGATVSIPWEGTDYESAFFDLEKKYKYFRFTAGACNVKSTTNSGEAWLTIKGDDETIFEELYSTHALPTDHIVDVSGVRKLEIAWSYETGSWDGMAFGIGDAYLATTKEAIDKAFMESSSWEAYYKSLPDRPVRLLNEVGTFGVYTQSEPAYYEGSTKLKTFTMAGEKFYEGFMLLAGNSMLQGSVPCCASFNLAGKYKTISFTTGHITNSKIYKPEELEVYADGKLIKTIEVYDKNLPTEYVIDVNNCQHLEFICGKKTMSSLYRPAIGVANLIAYPEGYVETDLFDKRKSADYPENCDLIKTFGIYGLYKASMKNDEAGKITSADGYYDGSTKKEYFTVNGGEKVYSGFILDTWSGMTFDTDMFDAMIALNLLGFTPFALAASGEGHEASFALANIRDAGYTKATFTVAPVDDGVGYDKENVLLIGADSNDTPAAEIKITPDMKPTEYTVDIGHCDRLIFYLRCTLDEAGSCPYGIYNITLSK